MDEQTERLRDIFMDVAEDGTVTESRAAGHGSLLREGEEERLEAVVERMREHVEFDTALDTAALCAVVRGFYRDRSDEAIATELGTDPEAVFGARMDLHLLRPEETDLDPAPVRERLREGEDIPAVAAEFDADEDAVERARQVGRATERARRVGQRFRTEFEELLDPIGGQLTDETREDGLAEATEDMEVDVDF